MAGERAGGLPEVTDGTEQNMDVPRDETRLYGVPGAEHLHFDPAACYETDIEPWGDEHDRRPRLIEEWSVHPPQYHLPTADSIVEWMAEWAGDSGELDEDAFEEVNAARRAPNVEAAAETLRDVLASHIRYRMSDKHLRTLTVTWNEAEQPLLDGEPMYVKAAGSEASSVCCECGRAPDKTLNERGKFTVELRPYGPGGADICYECATATPEAEAQTSAAFGALLDASEAMSPTGTTVIGEGHDRGPDPFDARAIDPDAEVIDRG